jgi:hypothetical protein
MTTAAEPRSTRPDGDRAVRFYRGLLLVYPRSFRDEFGDDLVQAFRDLMHLSRDGRGLWSRVLPDLFSSAIKERGASLAGGRRPSAAFAVVVVAVLIALGVVGRGPMSILLPLALLIVLPVYGARRLHHAWLVRRTTGARAGRSLAAGVASFVPAVVFLVASGPDRGWWLFAAIGLTLIATAAVGLLWAIATLVTSASGDDRHLRRRRAVIVLVPAVAVLAVIAGGSYNSYRKSMGPPGDHSVENASAESRALWMAAGAGHVDEVTSLSKTCADPWVKFPTGGDGRHNARGYADARLLDLPDEREAPYAEIMDILAETQDRWYDRCGRGSE